MSAACVPGMFITDRPVNYRGRWLCLNASEIIYDHRAESNSAAEQGHVLAERAIAMTYVSGRNGFLKIPYGLALYAKVVCDIIRVVAIKNEKMKYK
jgi:hypothetical protein